ncbi:molybdopterin-containing oxidoreductase family protein [Amycolatopsis jejuensis]|uniref:molybdopterin-containing oxidoreductase family protein n=1 Tax=Amycolatopsis jejuensis TaxID=330084 RepID=UPI000690DFDD|nr:molybdopterin-dependent oxidoreductase [Amycolatopsis jejuensis]
MEPETSHSITFCRLCPSWCGAVVDLDGTTVTRVRGDEANPVSRGYLCPKGRAMGAWHHHPDRLDVPIVRGTPLDWNAALDDASAGLRRIIDEHGPDAVGFFIGTAGWFDSLGKVAAQRFIQALETASVYSTRTIDNPASLLAAEVIAGHPALLPGPDDDARFVLWLGGNPVVSHGHSYSLSMPSAQLRKWASQGELWVVDPRRTETAELATRHLEIRAGTDHALLAFLVRELLEQGADYQYLAAYADGVETVRAAVASFTLDRAVAETGLRREDLEALLGAIRRAGRIAVTESTGVTFQAGANVSVWLVWVLNIITQSHDRPGGMFFNPGLLRRFHERPWPPRDGTPAPGPPSRPELPARWGEYPCAALADEIEAGNLRALVVVGGNPIVAIPQPRRLAAALRKLDLLVVSDVIPTETTALATHVLPSTGQLERADIWPIDFIHITQGNQYTPALVPPGGDRRPTWWHLAQLAKRLGHAILPDGADPDAVTEEHLARRIVESTGADFDELMQAPHGLSVEPRHYGWVEKALPDGRWRLAPQPFVDQLAKLSAGPPQPGFRVIAGRQRRHVNSQLTDGTGARIPDRPLASINPEDAEELRISDGDPVVVTTRHGSLRLTAHRDKRVSRGTIYIPHGFAGTNVCDLTSEHDDIDELTGLPVMTALPADLALQEPMHRAQERPR